MKEFECVNPNVRVPYQSILLLVDGFGKYRARGEKMVAHHFRVNLDDVSPDATFAMSDELSFMAEIKAQFGEHFLRKMGEHVYERFPFPAIDVAAFMAGLDDAYHRAMMNHDDKVGNLAWTPTSANSGTVHATDPFPCCFNLGLLVGAGRRLAPTLTVREEPDLPCRAKGADSCTYFLEW